MERGTKEDNMHSETFFIATVLHFQEMTVEDVANAELMFPKTYNYINHIMLDGHKLIKTVRANHTL